MASFHTVGRYQTPRFSAIPMAKPPTSAPGTLPMPPRTTAAKAFTPMDADRRVEVGLQRQERGGEGGQRRGQGEDGGDDAVGIDADHRGDREVVGGGSDP